MKPGPATDFCAKTLAGRKINLITLHHSLYYSDEAQWNGLFENLYRIILPRRGAIHAVMMVSKSDDRCSTTWLYNHFAGKYFGVTNDQDLMTFGKQLRRTPVFKTTQILLRTHRVKFFVDDFRKFMAVVWMILLYPNVHDYTPKQKEEITEHVYREFWLKKKPLIQLQNHLVMYKGFPFKGII